MTWTGLFNDINNIVFHWAKSYISAVGEITLAGIHVDPDDAVQEIDALASVHDTLVAHWNSDNVIIMGDFNADCGYVNNKESENLVLRDPKYKWLIKDGQDTTTKASDCTYDRYYCNIYKVKAHFNKIYSFIGSQVLNWNHNCTLRNGHNM